MTVQDLLEAAVRKMVPNERIENVIRKGDGTAYAWSGLPFWLMGFVDKDLGASIQDGFITVRRRMLLGFAGSGFDFRHALKENYKYPEDVISLSSLDSRDIVVVTSTNRLPLSIEPDRLSDIIHMCCDVSVPPLLSNLESMTASLVNSIWEARGFDLLK